MWVCQPEGAAHQLLHPSVKVVHPGLRSGPRSKLVRPAARRPVLPTKGHGASSRRQAAVQQRAAGGDAAVHPPVHPPLHQHNHPSPSPPPPPPTPHTHTHRTHARQALPPLTLARDSSPMAPSSLTSPSASTRTPSAHLAASTREILPLSLGGACTAEVPGGASVRRWGAKWQNAQHMQSLGPEDARASRHTHPLHAPAAAGRTLGTPWQTLPCQPRLPPVRPTWPMRDAW